MEILTPDLGTKVSTGHGKKAGRGHAWSWKKFASLLESSGTAKAKLAGSTAHTPPIGGTKRAVLATKTDDQLRLIKAIFTRTTPTQNMGTLAIRGQSKVDTESLTTGLGQLVKPGLQPTVEPTSEGKRKVLSGVLIPGKHTKKTSTESLDAMLTMLSIKLEPLAGKETNKKPTISKSEVKNSPAIMKTLGRAMIGDLSGIKTPAGLQSPALQEFLAAMGLKDGNALGANGRKIASQAQFQTRATGQYEVTPGSGKTKGLGGSRLKSEGRARAEGLSVPGKTKTLLGDSSLKTVKVDHSWESLIKKVTPSSGGLAPTGSKPEAASSETMTTATLFAGRSKAGGSLATAIEEAALKKGRQFQLSQEDGVTPLKKKGKDTIATKAAETGKAAKAAETGKAAKAAEAAKASEAAEADEITDGKTSDRRTREANGSGSRKPLFRVNSQSGPTPPEGGSQEAAVSPRAQSRDSISSDSNRNGTVMSPDLKKALDVPVPPKHDSAGAKPPQPMFSQVEAGLRHAYIVRPKSVTVRISPEELGEIKVQVTMENDRVQAKVMAESQKVVAILKDHQAELENRMRDQGMELEKLDIRQGDSGTRDPKQDQENASQARSDAEQREQARGQFRENRRARIEREANEKPKAAVKERESIYDDHGRVSVTA